MNIASGSVWIWEKYNEMVHQVDAGVSSFTLAHSVDALYTFLWDNYADWYVEYLKTDNSQVPFAKALFKQFLVKASPFIPFEAEVLWKEFFKETSQLGFEQYDAHALDNFKSQTSSKEFVSIINIISELRSIRGLYRIDPATRITLHSSDTALHSYTEFIQKAGKADVVPSDDILSFQQTIDGIQFSLNLEEYISDTQLELSRTQKDIESVQKQIMQLEKQLSNEKFVQNAAEEIIAEKKQALEIRKQELTTYSKKLEFLSK